MVIGLLLLLAAVTAESPLPLAELAPQPLPKGECALVLWERATRRRVVMGFAQPATVLVNSQGVVTLAQQSGDGDAVMGFRPHAVYASGTLRVELSLAIIANDGGAGGAVVRDGAITVTGADGVAVVAPVAGLVGCSS